MGLPGAGSPSAVMRRILPPSESGSWERDELWASPVVTYRKPSGPKAIRPPLWFEAARDAGEHRSGVLAEAEADHPVVAVGGQVGVDQPVLRIAGRDGQAEQAALAPVGAVEQLHLDLAALPVERQDAPGRALAHQRAAVGQEGEAPGHRQAGGDGGRGDGIRPSAPRRGPRWWWGPARRSTRSAPPWTTTSSRPLRMTTRSRTLPTSGWWWPRRRLPGSRPSNRSRWSRRRRAAPPPRPPRPAPRRGRARGVGRRGPFRRPPWCRSWARAPPRRVHGPRRYRPAGRGLARPGPGRRLGDGRRLRHRGHRQRWLGNGWLGRERGRLRHRLDLRGGTSPSVAYPSRAAPATRGRAPFREAPTPRTSSRGTRRCRPARPRGRGPTASRRRTARPGSRPCPG